MSKRIAVNMDGVNERDRVNWVADDRVDIVFGKYGVGLVAAGELVVLHRGKTVAHVVLDKTGALLRTLAWPETEFGVDMEDKSVVCTVLKEDGSTGFECTIKPLFNELVIHFDGCESHVTWTWK